MTKDIAEYNPNELMNRNSFTKIGFAFSGENLIDLAEKSGLKTPEGNPVFPFDFVGYKIETVKLEDSKSGELKEFESVLFLSSEGKIYNTSSKPVINDIRNKLEPSEFVARDEIGNLIMINGFIQLREIIEPVFEYVKGAGEYGKGYGVLR